MKMSFFMLVILLISFCCFSVRAGEREPLSADARKAFTQGARIEISLSVVDSTGKPVEGAMVNMGLSQKESGKFKSHAGETDTNGNWRVEANCSNLIHIRVMKEGYYETRIKRHLFSVNYADVNSRIKGRRWLPWNQTVVLKEKRKSTPLFVVEDKIFKIPLDEDVGLDLLEADLVKPFGTGSVTDLVVRIASTNILEKGRRSANRLHLTSATEEGGIILLPQNCDSQMKSIYHAPTNGFMDAVSFNRNRERRGGGRMYDTTMGLDEYAVFRVRVERDDEGRIVKSNYGKIYTLNFGDEGLTGREGYIKLNYYANPKNNDTNLEWDGKDLNSGCKYDIDKILAPL